MVRCSYLWYEFGMRKTAKVAISIPIPALRSLDRVCRQQRRSRSAAIAEADEAWLRERAPTEEDRRYVEAYLRTPERAQEVAAVAEAAIAGWESWE